MLPFQTIGDCARHGLELHVHCLRCFATRRVDLEVNTALHGRAIATTRFRCRRCGTPGLPKIRPAVLLQVGGPVTLAFLWCNTCVWEIDQTQLYKPPWSSSAQHYRVAASSGTFMHQRGGQEGFHRQLPLVQLAAYPEYDGKRDQHRERHSHAGAHVPEHNEFPDYHGEERSLATVIGAQGKAPAP